MTVPLPILHTKEEHIYIGILSASTKLFDKKNLDLFEGVEI